MKSVKLILAVFAAALFATGVATTSYAFHGGGVAECGGCHNMHEPAPGGKYLLVGTDQSSACLSCHERDTDTVPSSYRSSTNMTLNSLPIHRSPGGDFGWVKKRFTTSTNPTSVGEDGPTHGHDITAVDKGLSGRSNNLTAPGGTFDTAKLGCHSCHDPHGSFRRDSAGVMAKSAGGPIIASGSYAATTSAGTSDPPPAGAALGAYRLLAGNGYTTKGGETPGYPGVPMAKAPNTYNRTEAASETRVAYGISEANGHTTWSKWCGSCHGEYHSTGHTVHPVDTNLGTTLSDNYKKYVKSGDLTGGSANGFTSLVPFATAGAYNDGTPDSLASLATNTFAYNAGVGPASSAQVICLTCHRAHASGFTEMLRWNMATTFITSNSAYPNGTVGTAPKNTAAYQAAYYDRAPDKFASFQRVLCNKCHIKD